MKEVLDKIYSRAYVGNWGGNLIRDETSKVHDTLRTVTLSMTAIINSSTSSAEDKAWARSKIDALL